MTKKRLSIKSHKIGLDNGGHHKLDYKSAIDQGLPIGLGEIESAHRYVIQKRLKVAGGAWLIKQAGNMLALRLCRANRKWDYYWSVAA